MHALVLALLFAVPPQAPPVVDCPPVAPAVVESLPDHQGEPVVVEEPNPGGLGVTPVVCDCGGDCQCEPECNCVECDCTESAKSAVPPLVITVADRGCPPCERFKADALPRLVRAGWVEGRDYTLRVVPFGSETVPSFAWRGETMAVGYGSWLAWRAKLTSAMGVASVSQGATGYRVEKPVSGDSEQGTDREGAIVDRPVSGRQDAAAPGWHSHQCPCGHRWSHDVNNLGDWWAAHTCDRCGRLVTVHAD